MKKTVLVTLSAFAAFQLMALQPPKEEHKEGEVKKDVKETAHDTKKEVNHDAKKVKGEVKEDTRKAKEKTQNTVHEGAEKVEKKTE